MTLKHAKPAPAEMRRSLRRPNLAEQIASDLAARIGDGEFEIGQRLPTELVLSRTIGVSRAVIREAISRLKQEGLVDGRQGSGAFVTSLRPAGSFRLDPREIENNREQLSQVFELRLTLEGDAAGYAALRRSDDDLRDLSRCLDAIDADIRDGNDGIDADFTFHSTIARATGNAFILELVDLLGAQLKNSIRIARLNSSSYVGRPEAVLAEHREIYDNIADQRVEAARSAARRHVMNAAKRLGLSVGL
ncbi:FadR/GntR family transcriptional regulator [Bosea lathyri]|nr:FadR/GntR family transcriptional regulator [Bosea lathyri]